VEWWKSQTKDSTYVSINLETHKGIHCKVNERFVSKETQLLHQWGIETQDHGLKQDGKIQISSMRRQRIIIMVFTPLAFERAALTKVLV